jgi:hypothetical protein
MPVLLEPTPRGNCWSKRHRAMAYIGFSIASIDFAEKSRYETHATGAMNIVAALIGAFVFLYLMYKILYEWVIFFLHSNFKYKVLDFLADFIYYGQDIGVEATLKLDNPSSSLYARRLKGQAYLQSKLQPDESKVSMGEKLGPKIVDCRFSLHKAVMPLLRELEFSVKDRNYIQQVHVNMGVHRVALENGQTVPYLGGDAVHTLGYEAFVKPIQEEINRRMSSADSTLRFAPTSLNPELKKNSDMILNMTGMDQVRRPMQFLTDNSRLLWLSQESFSCRNRFGTL